MRRKKVYKLSVPDSEIPSIPLKNSERVRKEKRKQQVKRNSQEHEAVVRVQREKIRSGCKKDKRFENEDREGKSALYRVIYCYDDRLLLRAVICGHTV